MVGTSSRDLSHISAVVVGTVRNCSKTLVADVSRIRAALTGLGSISWFLVESDSDDDSLGVLNELSLADNSFRFVTAGRLQEKFPIRTERLAHCRNIYLEEVLSEEKYKNSEFVVVADFDGLNKKISRSGVESCWTRNDWAACFANQSGPYYDVWALRHPAWSPNDCWEQYEFMRGTDSRSWMALQSSVYARMLRIPPSSDWIPVESAFGGFAIYRKVVLNGARYRGVSDSGRPVCEHVDFNLEIRRAGHQLFINPAMVNSHKTEHSWSVNPLLRIGASLSGRFLGITSFLWRRT